jgi:hypothetical protein
LTLALRRKFMPKLLQATGPVGKAGWAPFQTLVMAQLQFLEPYLRTARLHESVRLLYQVTAWPRQCSDRYAFW